MFQVSQQYLDKLYGVGKKRRVVSALLDGVTFNENDIIADSLKFTLQAVGGAEINLGGVFLGQLWLTFAKSFSDTITRGTWKGKKIDISIGLEVSENVFEYIPIGVFTIDEANHTARGMEITAYDNMRYFDKALDFTTMSGSLYSFAKYACDKCGVALGMSREEIDALPNGLEVFSIYPDNDMETFRDLISWVSATAGGFATTSRTGALQIRGWSSEPVQTLGINDRYAGGSFSDFVTYYTGLSLVNIADQTTTYINNLPDHGLTMNLGANPLIQYGLADTKSRQLHAILNALADFAYTPFKVSAFADPFFDLGDVVQFNGGLAGSSSKCCIMRIDFSFAKGVTLQGFGKNPAMFGAQSKTDKDLSGISSHNQTNEIKYQLYTNAEDIDLPRDPRYSNSLSTERGGREQIAELTFTAQRESAVEVQAVVRPLTKMSRQQIEYRFFQNQIRNITRTFDIIFELDGEEVESYRIYDYPVTRPMPSASEGVQPYIPLKDMMEHYFALLHVEAGAQKTLRVYVEFEYFFPEWNSGAGGYYATNTLNGNIHFDPSDVKIYLRGQGLTVEKPWDGLIVVDDEVPPMLFAGLLPEALEDTVSVTIFAEDDPEHEHIPVHGIQDSVEAVGFGALGLPTIAEELRITFTRPTNNITTEDGEFNFTTEDGSFNLVTE